MIIDVLLVLNEFLELLLGKLVGDVGEVAAVVLAIVNGRISHDSGDELAKRPFLGEIERLR